MKSNDFSPITTFKTPGILAAFSSVRDGSMAVGGGAEPTEVTIRNGNDFADKYNATKRTRIRTTYHPDNTYTKIVRITHDETQPVIACDGMYTTDVATPISLTVADCIATIVYDPVTPFVAVLHLGRHASVAGLIGEFTKEVSRQLKTDPRNWQVWMSPSLQATSNRLTYFTPPNLKEWEPYLTKDSEGIIHIDTPAHNRDEFMRLGVLDEHMHVSDIDTYSNQNYFSHRAATERNEPERQGRMMLVASLLPQQ